MDTPCTEIIRIGPGRLENYTQGRHYSTANRTIIRADLDQSGGVLQGGSDVQGHSDEEGNQEAEEEAVDV
jgi:hypothetical protein